MYCVSVEFEIKTEHWQAFLERVKRQRDASLDEPACRAFDVWIASERPGRVFLHEIYDDADGFAAHLQTDHFQQFDSATAAMVADKSVQTWDRQL